MSTTTATTTTNTTHIPQTSTLPILLLPLSLSAYALSFSYQNITRLQEYEKTSEKAAEWSNTAAQRLHKTRTTQTSGTLSLVISAITPLVILSLPSSYQTSAILVPVALVNSALALGARQHMANFWNEKEQTRIPFVQKFNEAIKGSEKVVWLLGTLGLAWGAAGVSFGMSGFDVGTVGKGVVDVLCFGVVGVRLMGMMKGGSFWQ